jgi:phosphoenolpyruvate carboxylase
MLNLINSAEVQHRNRILRGSNSENIKKHHSVCGPLPLVDDSTRDTMERLLEDGLATKEQIYQQLLEQKVEIVLTAHPTQVQRRSMLRKYREVTEILGYLDRTDLDEYERLSAISDLRRIISSIWGADEVKRTKPTPQQEAAGGNAILETVLWDAVPSFLRKLSRQCQLTLGKALPISEVPIRFACKCTWCSRSISPCRFLFLATVPRGSFPLPSLDWR